MNSPLCRMIVPLKSAVAFIHTKHKDTELVLSPAAAALRLIALYVWTDAAMVIPFVPQSPATFTLPSPVVRTLRKHICQSTLLVQTLHWRVRGGNPRPRFNSTTRLMGNLTTLDLFSRCNSRLQKVSSFIQALRQCFPIFQYYLNDEAFW